MARYFTALLICFFITFSSTDIEAKDKVNSQEIAKEGFSDVSDIYNQMSPEQKEDVYNNAISMMEELEQMSPEEIEELKKQMLDMQNSLDLNSINVDNLDTTQELNLKKVKSDIKEYNKQK